MIYFDNAATTRVSETAAQTALRYMREQYGNASAAYSFGVEASRALEQSRGELAALLGAEAEQLFFTSCATESNNQAVKGILRADKQKPRRLLYSAAEHPSVVNAAVYMQQFEGCEALAVPVDGYGRIRLEELERLLQTPTALVCLQLVNNELGVIQPVREAAELAHRYGACILVDGVQGFGKIPCKVQELQADAFSVSGHKLHAPKGVGALWLSPRLRCQALLQGGGQESKRRSGTENLPGIAAFAAAAREACRDMADRQARIKAVRDALWEGLSAEISDIRLNTDLQASAPHILNVSFAGTKSEVLLHYLERQGICVSAGSACSTHKNAASGKNALLMACGLEDRWSTSCIRFSFSADNTVEEARTVAGVTAAAVKEIRMLMS